MQLVAFGLLLSCALARPQERALERETFANGAVRIERSVIEVDGAKLLDGPYKRFHENGAPAVEGAFERGAPAGEWRTFHENGKPRSVGAYAKGRRYGKWEFSWPNGQLAALGSYLVGLRDQRWVYLDPSGARVEAETGLYASHSETYAGPERRCLYETLNGVRHGRYASWWESGVRQAEGEFVAGARSGWWTFRHLDGSLEPESITGEYRDGKRVSGTRDAGALEPFAIPDEAPPELLPESDLARVPRFARLPSVKPSQRAVLQGWVESALAEGDEDARTKAEQALVEAGRGALPDVLNALIALDLAQPDGAARAIRLVERVLRPVAHGHGWTLSAIGDEGEGARNRRTILRWCSWFELAKTQDGYWSWLAQAPAQTELLVPELLDGSLGAMLVAAPQAGSEGQPLKLGASPFFTARSRLRRPTANTRAVDAALAWLAAHQAPDGAWQPQGFTAECGKRGTQPCDGVGLAEHGVGVTALALLAFLGSGEDPATGAHSENVLRALAWLVERQDPASGLIGSRADPSFLYGHALATLALAEASHAEPELRWNVELAARCALAAQNPGAGWRYALPPDGQSDTSVSAWMVAALAAARDAGFELPPSAFDGACSWFDRMTQSSSGRVGYNVAGSASARVAQLNTEYSPESGEPLTAAALLARALAGRFTPKSGLALLQTELLLAKLPTWAPAARTNDFYYWYWASGAVLVLGDKAAETWQRALAAAVLPAQIKDAKLDSSGSWDTCDPWSFAGGRVYSTAMLTLALEAPIRLAKLRR